MTRQRLLSSKQGCPQVAAASAPPLLGGGLWYNLGLRLITVCTNVVTTIALFVQMWHWGEKRRLAQYYSELYAREKAEEDAYTDELRSKLKALEEELLA